MEIQAEETRQTISASRWTASQTVWVTSSLHRHFGDVWMEKWQMSLRRRRRLPPRLVLSVRAVCVCVCVVHTANVRNKGQLDGEEAGLRVFWWQTERLSFKGLTHVSVPVKSDDDTLDTFHSGFEHFQVKSHTLHRPVFRLKYMELYLKKDLHKAVDSVHHFYLHAIPQFSQTQRGQMSWYSTEAVVTK